MGHGMSDYVVQHHLTTSNGSQYYLMRCVTLKLLAEVREEVQEVGHRRARQVCLNLLPRVLDSALRSHHLRLLQLRQLSLQLVVEPPSHIPLLCCKNHCGKTLALALRLATRPRPTPVVHAQQTLFVEDPARVEVAAVYVLRLC